MELEKGIECNVPENQTSTIQDCAEATGKPARIHILYILKRGYCSIDSTWTVKRLASNTCKNKAGIGGAQAGNSNISFASKSYRGLSEPLPCRLPL
jgi:hypothetical protein